MLTLKHANVLDLIRLSKINSDFLKSRKKINFYSEFNGSITSNTIRGNVYIIKNNIHDCGIIIIEKSSKEIYLLPRYTDISIFKIFHLINRYFNIQGFSTKIIYNKINLDELRKYFNIVTSENMMYMKRDLSLLIDIINDNTNELYFRPLKLYGEENVRAELQNSIFNNISGRSALTIEEIVEEYSNPKFMKNFCFLLEYYRTPIGYGQILKFNKQYMLVNFGIISEYRNKGFGFYFINNIFNYCKKAGIKNLYLSVDKNNTAAINLYKHSHFEEIYNKVTISFKKKSE